MNQSRIQILYSTLTAGTRLEGARSPVLLIELSIATFTFVPSTHFSILVILVRNVAAFTLRIALYLMEKISQCTLLEQDSLKKLSYFIDYGLCCCRI